MLGLGLGLRRRLTQHRRRLVALFDTVLAEQLDDALDLVGRRIRMRLAAMLEENG